MAVCRAENVMQWKCNVHWHTWSTASEVQHGCTTERESEPVLPIMSSEVSQASWCMNWQRPRRCSLVLLLHPTRTYWGHGQSDAHGCEHSVGHRAALIVELDAVVVAEESSLVRREGGFVQEHGNEHHCMVGQIHGHRSDSSWKKNIQNRKQLHRQEDKQKSTKQIEILDTQ